MRAIAQAIEAIRRIHVEEFRVAERPIASPPPTVDVAAMRTGYVDAALKGISVFRRAARRAATADALVRADGVAAAETYRLQMIQWQEQVRLDQIWGAILANDPDAVMDQLGSAFEDHAAPAAPLAVESTEATLAVLIPDEHAIPDQMPGYTASGNPSIRKMTKKEHDDIVGLLVAGYLLATVKEAFAVAPGLTSVRIVAVRSTGLSAYGHRRGEAMAAAMIQRQALHGVRWAAVDALTVLKDISTELILNERGGNSALTPLDLTKEPELAATMAIIDFNDLGDGD